MNLIQQLTTTFVTILALLAPPSTHVEGVVGQPEDINPPIRQENPVDRDLTSLIFSGLVTIDGQGNLQPDLAQSWEISEDGKEYTFHLKTNVFFHDRTPVTADDVIFSAANDPQLKDIGVERIDDRSIKFKLNDPFAPFLQLMTSPILPKHLAGKVNELSPVGAGPYKIFRVGEGTRRIDSIILTKFRRESAGPQQVIFNFFETEEELLTAAKLGELDGFTTDRLTWETYQAQSVPLNGRYFSLIFNLREKELLQDKSFRETLARLTPREKIIDGALKSNGAPMYSPFQNLWPETEDRQYSYNPTPKTNWDDQVSLTFLNSPEHQKTAKILADEWGRSGIRIDLDPQDATLMKNEIIPQRRFDILLVGQSVGHDPDRYALWHSTQTDSGANLAGYKNMRADRALEEGRKTMDPEERKQHYLNFQTVFMEDLPAIFLYQPTYRYYFKKGHGELNLTGIFTPEERWKKILALYP